MQNTRTDLLSANALSAHGPSRARLGRIALSAILVGLAAAPAAQAAGQSPNQAQPRPARPANATNTAAPTTNKPVDATAPAAPADPTPTSIGTGGVVELTSLDPEPTPARDTVVIPTDLEPGTVVPPPARSAAAARPASAGRALGKPQAADTAATAATSSGDRSLAAGTEEGGAFMKQVVPTALALGATIAVIFAARALVKRFGDRLGRGKRPSGVVEVLARYPFARGHHIVLIKVGRRILVTHQSAQGITTLSEFTSHAEVADLIARCEAGARGTDQFTFDSLLRNSDREFDAPALADRRSAAKPQRSDARAGLPASVRSAEIETIDLTRRRGVAR